MYVQLDINTEIYPMREGDKFMMVLASTLNLDGTPDTGYFNPVTNNIFFSNFIIYISINTYSGGC